MLLYMVLFVQFVFQNLVHKRLRIFLRCIQDTVTLASIRVLSVVAGVCELLIGHITTGIVGWIPSAKECRHIALRVQAYAQAAWAFDCAGGSV